MEELDPHVYKVIRRDGSFSQFSNLSGMLEVFDRDDVLDLHKIVMERFKDKDPEGYDLILWGDLKTMVTPSADDEHWRNQQDWNILRWKLYETCGVHELMLKGCLVTIYMFVEVGYPLNRVTLEKMLSTKLETESDTSLALDLIKYIKLQIEER